MKKLSLLLCTVLLAALLLAWLPSATAYEDAENNASGYESGDAGVIDEDSEELDLEDDEGSNDDDEKVLFAELEEDPESGDAGM